MTGTIPYIRDFDPEYGRLIPVSQNVRRLTAHNPSPFSGWGTNVYFIGKNQVSIIDPGPDTDAHFETLINVLGDEHVSRIFVTHHHNDHSPMAHRLAAHFGCQTYGFGPPLTQLGSNNMHMEAGNDVNFAPSITVHDGQVFDGPGWHIEAIHTPGHTSNHICYGIQEDNGLVCGDHIMAWATSVVIPPDGDMTDYIQSLRKVMARNFATLWPGHGAAITDTGPFIDAYIAHRQTRNTQIIDQLKSGQSLIKAIVPVLYADIDKRLHPAACISVLAHMIAMVKAGEIVCEGTPGLDSRYRFR